jgi:hypothetical protein
MQKNKRAISFRLASTVVTLFSLFLLIGFSRLEEIHPEDVKSKSIPSNSNEGQEKRNQEKVESVPKAEPAFHPVEIVLTLDKTRVVPEEKIRLTELIPKSHEGKISIINHQVYLIAEYDQSKGIFVNLKPDSYYRRKTSDDFQGLPSHLTAFGNGWYFDVVNPRQKGTELEFTANHIGVFQITADWLVSQKGYHHSLPVILIVEPPVNDKGERVVKPEWIIKD